MSEHTSPNVASIAARRLHDPDPEIRRLAGSALTQAPGAHTPTEETPMASKVKVSKEQYEAAQGVLAGYDRGTAVAGDIVHRILTAVHGDLVEIDGHRSMEEQYADSVASAQKGFRDQRPSQPHRPQVSPAFTVPDLPAGEDLPLETGDAVIARQNANNGDDTPVTAAQRPEASTPLAAAEQMDAGDGPQLATVANPNPKPATKPAASRKAK